MGPTLLLPPRRNPGNVDFIVTRLNTLLKFLLGKGKLLERFHFCEGLVTNRKVFLAPVGPDEDPGALRPVFGST